MGRIVGIAVDVPDMRDVVVPQVGVNALADPYQAVLLPTGEPEQLEFGIGGCGVGHEFLRGLGIGRG